MNPFKPGDVVICIDDKDQFPCSDDTVKLGNKYIVEKCNSSDVFLEGMAWSRSSKRFKLAESRKTVEVRKTVELCSECVDTLKREGII